MRAGETFVGRIFCNMKFRWLFRRRRERKAGVKSHHTMGASASHRKHFMDSRPLRAIEHHHHQRVTPLMTEDGPSLALESVVRVGDDGSSDESSDSEDLSVSFGYRFRKDRPPEEDEEDAALPIGNSSDPAIESGGSRRSSPELLSPSSSSATKPISKKSLSFSCLTGAALGANATLANTSICNGVIGEEILPGIDSPRTFRKRNSKTLELSQSVSSNAMHHSSSFPPARSVPKRMESVMNFLEAGDVQMAGGAAGEDRVQAVCSEEYGWLYCGIYDGFNGRDAADYLAGTFYENVGCHLRLVEWHVERERVAFSLETCEEGEISSFHVSSSPPSSSSSSSSSSSASASASASASVSACASESAAADASESASNRRVGGSAEEVRRTDNAVDVQRAGAARECESESGGDRVDEVFRQGVMRGLQRAFAQTEADFLNMVEEEMYERPDLAMVGSCVLTVLIIGRNLYTLNLGDSRAVLATHTVQENAAGRTEGGLFAVQLTESHVVENSEESRRILLEHPDDPVAISGARLKGKLKVTRAFGAGYLKQAKLNDGLMGILRVKDLISPPYLGSVPCVSSHRVVAEDSFVVLGSDGLFDFFTNEEVVDLVHRFVLGSPNGDPAKYMLEQLLIRAAHNADITVDHLKSIPIGRRRKFHDDVTVIVIVLGTEFHTYQHQLCGCDPSGRKPLLNPDSSPQQEKKISSLPEF